MMAPLVRRTWAPRGETPNLLESSGSGPREKVSVAAALWLTPRRDRLELYFQTLVNDFFNSWNVAAFLEALLVAVPGRVVVVWDGGPMHKGIRFVRRRTPTPIGSPWRDCRLTHQCSTRSSRSGAG